MNINLSFFPDFLDFFYDKCKKNKKKCTEDPRNKSIEFGDLNMVRTCSL